MLSRLLFKQKIFRISVIIVIILFVLVGLSGAMRIMAQTESNLPESSEAPSSESPLAAPQTDASSTSSAEPDQGMQDMQLMDITPPSVSSHPWPKYWSSIVGAVFSPANSGYSYQYGNSGCLKSNSPGYWRASVNLPDGSIAKYIYMVYYNGMYAKNSTAWLTRYQYNGDYQDLAFVSSRTYTTTGMTGYFFDLSSEITATIDNLNNGYTFIWSGSTTQRLCSVKVGYYPAYFTGNALPMITKP